MLSAADTGNPGAFSLTELFDAHLAARDVALFLGAASAERVLAGDLAALPEEALIARIGSDPALVAALLRDANASRFDALPPVGSLEAAGRRLGRERVEGLVSRVARECVLSADGSLLATALDQTWQHAFAVGCVARRVAEKTRHEELAAGAALLGSLADVGVLFLVAVLVDHDARRSRPLALTDTARRDVLAHLQGDYGSRLLESWGLPRTLLDVLADRAEGHAERKQSMFLRLARQVVASVGLLPAGSDPDEAAEAELWEIAEELELTNVDIAALQVHAEDAATSLAAPPTDTA